MTNKDKKDKWWEFVNLASQEMANHPTRNFTETVAMYLGDPCQVDFQVVLWNSMTAYFLLNFLIFYEKKEKEYQLYILALPRLTGTSDYTRRSCKIRSTGIIIYTILPS